MRKKKETVSTPQERKKKDKSTLRVRHQSFLTEMRDRQKERKKGWREQLPWRKGLAAVKKGGNGKNGKGWTRSVRCFSPPPPPFLPTFSPGGRWLGRGGSWSVGRSAGGGGVAVAAAAVVVVVLRRPTRKGAPPCAPIFESTADDGVCGQLPCHVSSSLALRAAVVWQTAAQFRSSLALLSAATKHSTCASAQLPFPFSFPPFLNSVSPILSPSLLPAAASSKRLKLRRCSKYFPSSPLSLLLAS